MQLNHEIIPKISESLNAVTGYAAVNKLKEKVLQKDAELNSKKQLLEAARKRYEDLIDSRNKMQRELTGLIDRRDSWMNTDIDRYTHLFKQNLSLEKEEAAAKSQYKAATESMETTQAELLSEIRERYIEEQLYSDKIRSVSTWYTWALILVHFTIFVSAQFIVEPSRRHRQHEQLSQLILETSQLNQDAVEKQFMIELRPLVERLTEIQAKEAEEAERVKSVVKIAVDGGGAGNATNQYRAQGLIVGLLLGLSIYLIK
ncbi:hypothetical protein SmJEL517_g01552 [Synchytrium microbalum]|uniref:Sensitive to high expression protein 9, mitochondrial n=1 Tax=Synchytrium microbalum TaxID=1806994 RepID=A0A507CFK4_9FUNG|nr:uncharacterized protein SmJEL517_g01552 [Synchytrium microbalum]TPX36365.1 hypothetical protein SmJEL517_g01552 [Synchytrium microbalum]